MWPANHSRDHPESTTIALLARLAGLLEPMREFLKTKPVWGTCAGAILLARWVENAKKGGQELLGGISVAIERNGFGSQVESFEAPLEVEGLRESNRPFPGIFIRAPVRVRSLRQGDHVVLTQVCYLGRDRTEPLSDGPSNSDHLAHLGVAPSSISDGCAYRRGRHGPARFAHDCCAPAGLASADHVPSGAYEGRPLPRVLCARVRAPHPFVSLVISCVRAI